MIAKEMFEELGYKETQHLYGFSYEKNIPLAKIISIYTDKTYSSTSRITIKEHKSIVEKMKELGWIK